MICGDGMRQSYFKEIIKQSSHDIYAGEYKNRYKYLIVLALLVVYFCNYKIQIHAMYMNEPYTVPSSFMDMCIYLFKGKIYFTTNPNMKYEIPYMWLSEQMITLYIVGSYASDERTRLGQQYLIRTSHTSSWLLGKVAYAVVSIVLYYCLLFVFTFAVTVPFSHQVFTMHEDLIAMSSGIFIANHTTLDMYRAVFVMPFLTSLVFGIAMVVLQLVVKPVYVYGIELVYVLASDYKLSYFLIGNYSMIVRNVQQNRQFIEEGITGFIDPAKGIVIELILIVVLCMAGNLVLKKYDYLERE